MTRTNLFWIAIILIAEPLLALAWPRIKVGFFISRPGDWDTSERIKTYYDHCRDNRFGAYGTLRRKIRVGMWMLAIIILITLTADNMFNLNIF